MGSIVDWRQQRKDSWNLKTICTTERKQIEKNKQSTKIYKTKRSNICVTGVPKGEEECVWKKTAGAGGGEG